MLKPYFDENNITLYHGDCRDLVPLLFQKKKCSMVLADPPYGETSLKWDKSVSGWLPVCREAMADFGSLWCFGSFRSFMACWSDFEGHWRFSQEIIWEKHNGSNALADRFRRVHEIVSQFFKSDVPWAQVYKRPQFTYDATKRTIRKKGRPAHWGHIGPNSYESVDGGPRLMRSVIRAPSCHGNAVHPTQKPIGLLAPLIEYSSHPQEGLVLVPFAGGGSELVAAKLSGRRAIGFETDEKYCEIAAKRLAQGVLFGGGE